MAHEETKEQTTSKMPFWKVAITVGGPVVAILAVFAVLLWTAALPRHIDWGDLSLAEPFRTLKVFQDNGALVYGTLSSMKVRAAASGLVVINKTERKVELRMDVGGSIYYRAFRGSFVNIKEQRVVAGEDLGILEPIGPVTAELYMELVRNGETVPPPSDIPPLFQTAGQRIYVMADCAGCHDMRGVYMLEHGKLRNGQAPTRAAIESIILNGAIYMPAYKNCLSVEQLAAVVEFVCQHHCKE